MRNLRNAAPTRGWKKAMAYFDFSGGETADWVDRTVDAHSLSSLSLEQWMAEFEWLKKLNKDILRGSGRKGSREAAKNTSETASSKAIGLRSGELPVGISDQSVPNPYRVRCDRGRVA